MRINYIQFNWKLFYNISDIIMRIHWLLMNICLQVCDFVSWYAREFGIVDRISVPHPRTRRSLWDAKLRVTGEAYLGSRQHLRRATSPGPWISAAGHAHHASSIRAVERLFLFQSSIRELLFFWAPIREVLATRDRSSSGCTTLARCIISHASTETNNSFHFYQHSSQGSFFCY